MLFRSQAKEDTDYSAPDRAAVTKDNKPSVSPAATKADTSGPSAADKAGLAAKIKAIREAKAVEASNEVTAPKDYSEPRKPNKNAVTKAPVPGVSIAEDEQGPLKHTTKGKPPYKRHVEEAKKYRGPLSDPNNPPHDGKDPARKKTALNNPHNPPGDVDESVYSAKAARAGKDIGKPGKNFAKIAAKAGKIGRAHV